jgi:hypothetical protein
MAVFDLGPINPNNTPELMAAHEAADVTDIYDPRESEGFFEPRIVEDSLYEPAPGFLLADKSKELDGGAVHIATYQSSRASHRVGIYVPEGYDTESGLPIVVMQTPLLTGVKGHNQFVAEEMMRKGFVVVKKGPPRYSGPFNRALSLTEDANEIFGALQQLDSSELVGKIQKLWVYGESQGAMKMLAAPGLANHYGFEVVNGLIVAPCYLRQINFGRPDKQIRRLAGMVMGTVRYAQTANLEDLKKMRGTVSRKDLHHHLAVLPVLISGETGTFLDYIGEEQQLTVQLFGKDGNSSPYHSAAELTTRFKNMDVRVDPSKGHVDGIKSIGVSVLRNTMLYETRKQYDVRENVA